MTERLFLTRIWAPTERGAIRTTTRPWCLTCALKNIEVLKYTESAVDEQSTIYVGGAGEADEREIIIVGDDKTGLDRVERFRDARDVEAGDTDKLTERGNQTVVETQATIATTAVAGSGLVYGVDYHLGDIVTTRVTKKPTRKTEITIILSMKSSK